LLLEPDLHPEFDPGKPAENQTMRLTPTSSHRPSTNSTRMQVAPSTNHSKNPQVSHTDGTERHKDPTFPRRRRRRWSSGGVGSTAWGLTEPAPNPRRITALSSPDRAALGRRATLAVEAHRAATFSFSPNEHPEQTTAWREEDPCGGKRVTSGLSPRPGGRGAEGGGRGCGIH
jgi:hypothetical protein